jgi:hypothetical protein
MDTKKRKRGSEVPADADIVGEDLLGHLDDRWQLEQRQERASERHRSNANEDTNDCVGDVKQSTAQVCLPLWKGCLSRLRCASVGSPIVDTGNSTGGETLPAGNVGSDEDDLLKHLDVERRRELNRLRQRRFQARRREKPLLDQKKRHRHYQQQTQMKTTTVSEELFDNELSEEERASCMSRLRVALGAEKQDECACSVCDRLSVRCETRRIEDTDWKYMDKMKVCLKVVRTRNLPDDLVDQYCAPPFVADLEGVMVSPRGFHSYLDDYGSPRAWFSVCKECNKSLGQGVLPKFSIANGFFIGVLKENLCGLTLPERFMTQLVSIVAITRVMRGGRHRCIRSHCMAFDCTPGPPILLLPRSIEDVASYRVVMVGEFTSEQTTKVRKMHRIRNGKVRDLFKFFKENNHLYADVTPNESALQTEYPDADIENILVEHVDDGDGALDEGMTNEQENVLGMSDELRVTNEQDETNVIERRMGLSDNSTPVLVR